MNAEQIITTLWTVLAPVLIAVAVAAITAWGNAMIYAAQMIYQAYLDPTLKTGPDKMAWVVTQVKAYLPRIISQIVSDSKVQSACQSIYDAIKNYATAYLKDKTEPENTQSTGGGE